MMLPLADPTGFFIIRTSNASTSADREETLLGTGYVIEFGGETAALSCPCLPSVTFLT
jgi:hypothetical protein